jgi:hypothetical protein
MKRFGALLLLGATVNLSLSPTARSGVPKSSITRPGSVFTTKVDWFKRPPKGLALGSGTRLPYGLTVAVPAALRQEAASLLGEADTLSLTNEQVARFGVTTDVDSICRARIDELEVKLKFFQEHPVEVDMSRRFGKREFEDMKKRQLVVMNDLRVEIEQVKQLDHQLKPYLVKAVILQSAGTFSATLVGDQLVVRFDAMGSHAVPMERCPVVAFLPTKPRRVYTAVGMTQ